MNKNERMVIVVILALISVIAAFDLITDSREGVTLWHVIAEGGVGVAALFGAFYILRGSFELKHRLEKEITEFSKFKQEAEHWRSDARKYIDGLAQAIDTQLNRWGLSPAEKEVAFLLLKGLSLKEIAEVRKTAEKTARTQSMSIYNKSGLAGRSELAAFFLEDLLVPTEPSKLVNDQRPDPGSSTGHSSP